MIVCLGGAPLAVAAHVAALKAVRSKLLVVFSGYVTSVQSLCCGVAMVTYMHAMVSLPPWTVL
jgi:hypothetical protein